MSDDERGGSRLKCIHELGKERRTAQTTNDSFPLAASNTAFISGALHGGSKDQGRFHFLRFLELPWLFYSSQGTGRGRSMHTYLARPRQPNSSESDARLRTWTWRDAALYIPPFFPFLPSSQDRAIQIALLCEYSVHKARNTKRPRYIRDGLSHTHTLPLYPTSQS